MRPRLLGIVLLTVTIPLAAAAQAPAPFVCNAIAAVPPTVRGEGLAELTGDVILNCSGNAPAGGITANVSVFLNTLVTSKLIGATSEALILIDEPAPGTQMLGVNLFQGVVSGANVITFTGIPFADAPGGLVTRVLRITNIRVNANAIGAPGQALALISISGSTSIPLNNPVQTVAFIQTSTAFPEPRCIFPGIVEVGFAEVFATAFKVRGGTGQSTPGTIYNTESGFTPDPIIPGVGTADSGTQLGFVLSGIQPGVQLSVPPSVTEGSLTITAVNPLGGGAVPVVNGMATIVYEVTAASPLTTEEIVIPVSVSDAQGTLTVRANLYPISTVGMASDTAPIPRFVDVSTEQQGTCGTFAATVPTLSPGALLAAFALLITIAAAALRSR
jgi:hypothetical protein